MSNPNIISIQNKDRSREGENLYKFNVSIGSNSVSQNISGVFVRKVSFLNTQYNIKRSQNKFYYTTDGATLQFVELSAGQYKLQELIDALEAALLVAGVTVGFTFLPKLNKILMTSAVPAIEIFDYKYSVDNFLGQRLGIISDMGIVANVIFGGVPNLSGLSTVYIKSRALSVVPSLTVYSEPPESGRTRLSKTVTDHIIECIPCSVPDSHTMHWENQVSDRMIIYPTPRSITDFDIELYDEDHELLNLEGGAVEIILEFIH